MTTQFTIKVPEGTTTADIERALASIGIKADEVTNSREQAKATLARRKADKLFDAWWVACRIEEGSSGPQEGRQAAKAVQVAYDALIAHLDSNGLTGRWWDPRGSNEEEA